MCLVFVYDIIYFIKGFKRTDVVHSPLYKLYMRNFKEAKSYRKRTFSTFKIELSS